MDSDDFWAWLDPVEDKYGGGYRTRHVILKRRHASLSLSAYSCRLCDKIAPNRDYMSEGLCSFVGGESWKFIDAFAVGLKANGSYQKLKPGPVKACPWECEYSYSDGERKLAVSYYLFNSGQGGSGVVNAMVDGDGSDVSIVFEPFFDIRPYNAVSGPEGQEAGLSGDTLTVSSGDIAACVRSSGAVFTGSKHVVSWKYKLGWGERKKEDDRIRPVPGEGKITSFYEIEVPGKHAVLRFSCSGTREGAWKLLDVKWGGPQEDIVLALSARNSIFPEYKGTSREKGVVWRALGMARFGMDLQGTKCMEAGCLMSREILFRDQFEGMLNNYRTIMKLNVSSCIRNALLKAYELQDKWGRIPAGYAGGVPDHDNSDATMIAFILAGLLVRESNDGDLAIRSADAFRKFLAGVCACDLAKGGPPMIKPNGLVSVAPAMAGSYGRRTIEGKKVPERISPAWAQELISKGAFDETGLQKYLLPEVNARWIRCLEAGWLFSKYVRDFMLADRCKMFYYRALEAYKPLFYNEGTGFVNNMATTDESALGRRVDPGVGSAGMVSAAILGTDVFAGRELQSIAAVVKMRLLRKKWGRPFGTVMMDGAECVYLDDNSEYGGTLCPGDTPYLIELLRATGDPETANEVLDANLRHQMEEGFVFYNNEMFSCDHDMVPSGDPVRWRSQWVDPYL